MDLNYLKKVLKIFDDSSATVIKIEEEGLKIRISKNDEYPSYTTIPAIPPTPPLADTSQAVAQPSVKSNEEENKKENKEKLETGHKIKSPIVGTFYRAPSPETPPFVEIGTHVNKGDTLCIVEAMKLMNEIESDISGVVQKISIENADPVEYGQTLFIIKPD